MFVFFATSANLQRTKLYQAYECYSKVTHMDERDLERRKVCDEYRM